jgi:hypothetical protein
MSLAVVGFVRTRVEDRKRYTLGVLMGYSHSIELLRSLHAVREYAAGGTQVDGKIDDAVADHLAIVLPHFQSIALAAKSGLLDREIILSARYGSMKAIWASYGPYVRAKRVELDRPLLYVELEEFLRENASRYEQYQRQFTERYISPRASEAVV